MGALRNLRNLPDLVDIAVLSLLGGIVLFWFGGPGIMLGVDSFFVLRPEIAIHDALSAWSSTTSAGVPNFAIQTLPFYLVFWLLVHVVGIRGAETIVQWTLISLSALGMRAFLRAIFDERELYAHWLVVGVAILYTLNPFTTSFVWWHQMWIGFSWATFPWLCTWLVLALRGRISARTASGAGAVTLLVAAPGYPHVLLVPLFLFLLAIYVVIVANITQRTHALRIGGLVLFWWSAALAWWIVPSLVFLHDTLSSWSAQYRGVPEEMLIYGSQFASLANVIRFIGLLQLHLYVGKQPLFPWFTTFSSTAGVLLYVFPLLTVCGIVAVIQRKDDEMWRYSLLCLMTVTYPFGIFLMKGGHEPLAAVNKLLLKLPLGAAWQHPYDKFALPVVLAASTLTYYACVRFANLFPNMLRMLVPTVMAGVVIVEGWPAYTGGVITPQSGVIPGGVAVIPDYYNDLQSYLASIQGFTLQLPLRDNGETAFNWDRGAQTNNDPVLEYFNGGRPVVRLRTGYRYADALLDEANSALRNRSRAAILSGLGFGDVVLHRDWNIAYMPVTPEVPAYERILEVNSEGTAGIGILRAGKSSQGLKLPISGFSQNDFAIGLDVRFDDITREQTVFATDNGLELRWLQPGYFGLYAPSQDGKQPVWVPSQTIRLKKGQSINVNVSVHNGQTRIVVDGMLVGSAMTSPRAAVRSAFVGSENRYHRFQGTISDFWIQSGARLDLIAAQDPLMRRRAQQFDWTLTNAGAQGPSVPSTDVIQAPSGSSGLKLPIKSFDSRSFDVSMLARFNDVRREQVLFSTGTGIELRWSVPGYFELIDSFHSHRRIFTPLLALKSGKWFRIEFRARDGVAQIFVAGVPVASGPWSVMNSANAVFLGSPNRFQPFSGEIGDVSVRNYQDPAYRIAITEDFKNILKTFGWRLAPRTSTFSLLSHQRLGGLDLFLTPCPTGYVYTADAVSASVSTNDTLARRFACGHRAAVVRQGMRPLHCRGLHLDDSQSADISGTNIRISGSGRCLVVFNTSYAPDWTLAPITGDARVISHEIANGYASAFVIETHGRASFKFRYARQFLVWLSATLGFLVLVISLALLLCANLPFPFKFVLTSKARNTEALGDL